MRLALNKYKAHEALFDNLQSCTITVAPTGLSIWCSGDVKASAVVLEAAFDIKFTRKKATDRCYDWVSEIDGVPITFNLVEYTNEDLTGTLAPLAPTFV